LLYNQRRPHQGRGMNGRTPAIAFREGPDKLSTLPDYSQRLGRRDKLSSPDLLERILHHSPQPNVFARPGSFASPPAKEIHQSASAMPRKRTQNQSTGVCREVPGPDIVHAHSITSSARASSVGGTSRPSAFAGIRLMARSNLVGCSTGMSPGLAPRRIRSTKSAARDGKRRVHAFDFGSGLFRRILSARR
jgi:hypothetical protein